MRFDQKQKNTKLIESIMSSSGGPPHLHPSSVKPVRASHPLLKPTPHQTQPMKSLKPLKPSAHPPAPHPVPVSIRKDPFASIPPLTVSDLDRGIYILSNQGYLPRYVDITPALQRLDPILSSKVLEPNQLLYNESLIQIRQGGGNNAIDMLGLGEDGEEGRCGESESKVDEMVATQPFCVGASEDSGLNKTTSKDLKLVTKTSLASIKTAKSGSQPSAKDEASEKPKKASSTIIIEDALSFNKKQIDSRPEKPVSCLPASKKITVANGVLIKDDVYRRLKAGHIYLWGDIEELIEQCMEQALDQKVTTFNLDFNRLKELSFLPRAFSPSEIASCIENYQLNVDFVKAYNRNQGETEKEFQARFHRVITKIQKSFRKLMSRRLAQKLADINRKIKMIQFRIRLKRIYQETVKRSAEINAIRYKQFLKLNEEFVKSYPKISQGPRVEIHVNSLSTLILPRL